MSILKKFLTKLGAFHASPVKIANIPRSKIASPRTIGIL